MQQHDIIKKMYKFPFPTLEFDEIHTSFPRVINKINYIPHSIVKLYYKTINTQFPFNMDAEIVKADQHQTNPTFASISSWFPIPHHYKIDSEYQFYNYKIYS